MPSYGYFLMPDRLPVATSALLLFSGPWSFLPLSVVLTVGGPSLVGIFMWHFVDRAGTPADRAECWLCFSLGDTIS